MPLSDALEKLKNAVGDLTSLEVHTYVGKIDVFIKEEVDTTSFEDTLKKSIQSGEIKLSLITKINFDGDGIVLVPDSAPADYIQQAHDAAMRAGNDVRQGLIELFSDVIGIAIPKKS